MDGSTLLFIDRETLAKSEIIHLVASVHLPMCLCASCLFRAMNDHHQFEKYICVSVIVELIQILSQMRSINELLIFTLHDSIYLPISSQSTSWQLGVKSKCYEHNSCVRLGRMLPWIHVELRKSSHHIHHMLYMSAVVATRNMFGWDSYLDLEVICIAHIGG